MQTSCWIERVHTEEVFIYSALTNKMLLATHALACHHPREGEEEKQLRECLFCMTLQLIITCSLQWKVYPHLSSTEMMNRFTSVTVRAVAAWRVWITTTKVMPRQLMWANNRLNARAYVMCVLVQQSNFAMYESASEGGRKGELLHLAKWRHYDRATTRSSSSGTWFVILTNFFPANYIC